MRRTILCSFLSVGLACSTLAIFSECTDVSFEQRVYAQDDLEVQADYALVEEFYNEIAAEEYQTLINLCEGAYANELEDLVESGTDYKTGLYSISDIHSMSIVASIPVDDYQYRITGFDPESTHLYLVQMNLATYEENPFYFDGVNYELVACGSIDGERKITDVFSPMPETVQEYGTETQDIQEYLTSRFGRGDVETLGNDVSYTFSSMPNKIRVKRVKYGNNPTEIEEVNFKEYCKYVMAGEFAYDSRPTAYLRAGALCVRNFAWYHYLTASSSLGYHVLDDTSYQKYDPTLEIKNFPNSCSAVDYIWNIKMQNSSGKLFISQYRQNSGDYHGGILNQTKAYELANNGYSFYRILHYYYDNSTVSTGTIVVTCAKGHTTNGAYYYNSTSHWKLCTVCGNKASMEGHNYIVSGSNKTCRYCGYATTNMNVTSITEEQ
jgi:hypothetical protein